VSLFFSLRVTAQSWPARPLDECAVEGGRADIEQSMLEAGSLMIGMVCGVRMSYD
jgi:hypothetical protein